MGLVNEGHAKSDADIRELMSGNICRCGAYPNIVAAVCDLLEVIRQTFVDNSTYALYKFIMMCVKKNRLFQAFINYPLVVNRRCCRGNSCSFPTERYANPQGITPTKDVVFHLMPIWYLLSMRKSWIRPLA